MSDIVAADAVTPVWIDLNWLSWKCTDEGRRHVQDDRATRLYEIHQHACDRLAGDDPKELDRVDAIITLRRAVGQRTKALKEIYAFRELPIGAKPKHDLELL
jgi:hypothetical protein